MNNAKKLASLLLVLALAFTLAVPALAEGEDAPADTVDVTVPATANTMEGPTPALEEGSITIKNAVPGQTYTLYQLLYLESYKITETAASKPDGTDRIGKYAYKPTTVWTEFLNTDGAKQYLSISSADDGGYVTWLGDPTDSRAAELTRLAMTWLETHTITPAATVTVRNLTDAEIAAGKTTLTVKVTGLKLGYYLMDTTVGTLCDLYTTNSDITINDKHTLPGNRKGTKENGGYYYTSDTSMGYITTGNKDEGRESIQVGIEYMSSISLAKGAENYVLHDKMEAGIEFIGITDVVRRRSGEGQGAQDYHLKAYVDDDTPYDYKIVKNPGTDNCDFHLEFSEAFLDTVTDAGTLDVYYTAKLVEGAKIGGTRPLGMDQNVIDADCEGGNVNTSWLSYGANGDMKTVESLTRTYTWEVEIHKIDYATNAAAEDAGKEASTISLEGAEFELCTDSDGKQPITFKQTVRRDKDGEIVYKKDEDGNEVIVDGKKVPEVAYLRDPEATTTQFVTDKDGRILFQGLDSGTYFLWERKAPDGYKMLTTPVRIVIKADGSIRVGTTDLSAGDIHVDVRNSTGGLLPTTGGMGTTLFYILGGILAVGAAVLLITKKRVNAGESI